MVKWTELVFVTIVEMKRHPSGDICSTLSIGRPAVESQARIEGKGLTTALTTSDIAMLLLKYG